MPLNLESAVLFLEQDVRLGLKKYLIFISYYNGVFGKSVYTIELLKYIEDIKTTIKLDFVLRRAWHYL